MVPSFSQYASTITQPKDDEQAPSISTAVPHPAGSHFDRHSPCTTRGAGPNADTAASADDGVDGNGAANRTQRPDSTTARFGDWTVTCTGLAAAPPAKVCETTQSIIVGGQGQGTTLGIVAVGRPAKDKPYRLVKAVPVNISIASGVKVTADPAKPPMPLAVRRCVPGGCFAAGTATVVAIEQQASDEARGD